MNNDKEVKYSLVPTEVLDRIQDISDQEQKRIDAQVEHAHSYLKAMNDQSKHNKRATLIYSLGIIVQTALILLILLLCSNTYAKTGAWTGGPLGCPPAGTSQNVIFEVIEADIPEDALITNVVLNISVSEPFPTFWLGAPGTQLMKVIFPSTDFIEYYRGLNALDTYFYLYTINEWTGNCTAIIVVNWESEDFNPATLVPAMNYLLN